MMLKNIHRISYALTLTAIAMLLVCKVLPHHHHVLHLPGTLACIPTLHFSIEECENDESHHHHKNECPSNEITYIACPDEEFDIYKNNLCNDFPPLLAENSSGIYPPIESCNFPQQHIKPKIPDDRLSAVALRAPPTV